MTKPVPPLPPDVAALLEGERSRPGLPVDVQARVKQRLHASIQAGITPESRGLDLSVPRPTGLGTPLVATGLAVVVSAGLWVATRADLPVAPPPPAPPPVQVVVPVVVPPVPDPVPAVDTPAPEEPPAPVVVKRAAPPRAVPSMRREPSAPAPVVAPTRDPDPVVTAEPVEDLAAEQAILETARRGLRQDRVSESWTALQTHARQFPSGRLAEERAALEVVALERMGRHAEAVQRARGFRAAYPRSVFLPMVDAVEAP